MPPAEPSAEPDAVPADHGTADRSGSSADGSTGVEDTLDLEITEELLALIAEGRSAGAARAGAPGELLGDPGPGRPRPRRRESSPFSPSGPSAISPSSAAG